MTRAFLALSIATFAWACDGKDRPDGPTSPSAMPAYTLSGVVSTEVSAVQVPIEGAVVILEGSLLRRESRTDASGRYRMSAVPAGAFSLSTTKNGFASDTRSITISGDTQVDVLVARGPRGPSLFGTVYEVTATGLVPLQGVEVYWSEYKGTATDANGSYLIEDLYPGVQPIWVLKEGYTFAVEIPHALGDPWRDVTIEGDTRFDVQLVRR